MRKEKRGLTQVAADDSKCIGEIFGKSAIRDMGLDNNIREDMCEEATRPQKRKRCRVREDRNSSSVDSGGGERGKSGYIARARIERSASSPTSEGSCHSSKARSSSNRNSSDNNSNNSSRNSINNSSNNAAGPTPTINGSNSIGANKSVGTGRTNLCVPFDRPPKCVENFQKRSKGTGSDR